MSDEGLKAHLEQQIAATRKKAEAAKLEKNRHLHEKKLELLSSVQRYVEGKPTREDSILADVINDLMQSMPLLSRFRTFRDR